MLKYILVLMFSSPAFAAKDFCTIAGPADAPVTIEEYADFQCPFCKRAAKTMDQILKNYPDKVRLVIKNMPLSFHPQAMNAAKAFTAVCMQSSALAKAYYFELFNNQSRIAEGETYLYEAAGKVGADVNKMKTEMAGGGVDGIIADDAQQSQMNDITGTPGFMIGTEKVAGAYPYEDFAKIIDKQLGK